MKKVVIIENGDPWRELHVERWSNDVILIITQFHKNKGRTTNGISLTIEDADELGNLLKSKKE